MELTSKAVHEIIMDCLFDETEDRSNAIIVKGIVSGFGFNPVKLEKHKEEILALLDELPNDYKEGSGGGMTFLNACYDKHGNQWTGEHRTMEELFCLGIAVGAVTECLPRDMWEALPGGMPYYAIKKREVVNEQSN